MNNYFYIISKYGDNELSLNVVDSYVPDIKYSTDGETWAQWDGSPLPINKGVKMYFKGDNGIIFAKKKYTGSEPCVTFKAKIDDNKTTIGGNVMSLLDDGACTQTEVGEYCFSYLFIRLNVIELADDFELPATTLARGCYYHMFFGCTSLSNAPELPAITLADGCYSYMFYGCSSLVNAPALPATTLASECYFRMFEACKSLVNAPKLPATTLADSCYQFMFQGCTSLSNAPELPATTLADECYAEMFYGCTKLEYGPEILPATTLVNSCYDAMFKGCTSLVKSPKILALYNVVEYDYFQPYKEMFNKCENLREVYILLEDPKSVEWLSGVPESTECKFYKNSKAEWEMDSPKGIPHLWTVYNVDTPTPGEDVEVDIEVNYGTIDIDGEKKVGSTVIIRVYPFYGFHFDQWSDGNTDNPRTMYLTGDVKLTAYVAADPIPPTPPTPEPTRKETVKTLVGQGEFNMFLESTADNIEVDGLTDKYTFDDCASNYVLYYKNAFGGYDALACDGKVVKSDDIKRYSIVRHYRNTRVEFGKFNYTNSINEKWSLVTGYLTDFQSNRMYHLIESTEVYLHILSEDKIVPVVINDTSHTYKTFRNQGNKLVSYTINVSNSQNKYRR